MAGLTVDGLVQLNRLFAAAGPEAKKRLDKRMRELAEPVRVDAETLTRSGIPRIGPRWSQMRTGVTQRAVYIAPRQRGTRRRGDPRSRPNLARLLDREMTRALEQNQPRIEQSVEALFYELSSDWNRRG